MIYQETRYKDLLKNLTLDIKEKIFEQEDNMEQFIPYLTTEIGFSMEEIEELGINSLEEEYGRG